MRRALPYLLKAIGIALFVFILLQIDTEKMLLSIQGVSIPSLLLTLALFPVIYLIKTWRWHVLTVAAGASSTFQHSTQIYMSGLFLGIITPGKIGEAMKIPALVSKGLAMKEAVSITILDRLLDIALLGVIAIWAVALLISNTFALALGSVVAIVILVIYHCKSRFPGIHHFFIPKLETRIWIKAVLITMLNWCVYYAQFCILAYSFGLSIDIPTLVAIQTITGIVGLLPIAPAGLGTRDATLLFFFGNLGITPETTIAFSFTLFVLTVIGSSIGGYFWLRYPMKNAAK